MLATAHPLKWQSLLSKPLCERIGAAPAELVEHLRRYNAATKHPAVPDTVAECGDFLRDIQDAVAELPEVVAQMLEHRLLGIFVMIGVGSSAITDVIAHPNGDLIGAVIAVDVDAFEQRKANEWATWRENNPFMADDGTHLSVRIATDAGNDRKSALQYILLHECGYVAAAESSMLPNWWGDASDLTQCDQFSFLPLSWEMGENRQLRHRAGQNLLPARRFRFFEQGKLPGSEIRPTYRQLELTSFPTLYASTNPHEDFAESFATYVHTVLLKKPRDVSVIADGREVARFDDFWTAPRGAAKAAYFDALFKQGVPPFQHHAQHAEIAAICAQILRQSAVRFLGLAPFLRLSIARADLRELAEPLLQAVQSDQDNPHVWMNLATVFFAAEQRPLGLAMQAQGLLLQSMYTLPALRQPARFTLLMLMAPGDLAENTPLDCLLEDSDIDLILYFTAPDRPLPPEMPVHDAIMVAFSDSDANRATLQSLVTLLQDWQKPVINAPQHIPNTERNAASRLLHNVPGLLIPPTHQISRDDLAMVAQDQRRIDEMFMGCRFPIIVRPVGSHAGRDLERIEDVAGVAQYLSAVSEAALYISNFIDYRSADGLFRKYRVAIVAGRAFASHMAISSHWMIHYVNAGMYEDSDKRAEEARFMADFASFAQRHEGALRDIYVRSKLEYICIDCAETRDGELLIFEIDHAMVVHAMDSTVLFPHKQVHMHMLRRAVEDLLYGRLDSHSRPHSSSST